MQFGQRPTVGKTLMADVAHEIFDSRFCEGIWQTVRGEMRSLDRKEPVEQPVDFGRGRGLEVAVPGQLCELAVLVAQLLAHAAADLQVDFAVGGSLQVPAAAVAGGGLMRQE